MEVYGVENINRVKAYVSEKTNKGILTIGGSSESVGSFKVFLSDEVKPYKATVLDETVGLDSLVVWDDKGELLNDYIVCVVCDSELEDEGFELSSIDLFI